VGGRHVKLWIDDVRPAPDGYVWAKSTNEAIRYIKVFLHNGKDIELINIDHDSGDYYDDGGDYIRVLDWLERHMCDIPIHIHSMNPVGVDNMRRIIQRNGWKEV
jgi:hypothetical protein